MISMIVNDRHDDRWPKQRLFQPVDTSQLKLFMHCTGGLISASRQFLEAYKEVFELHGFKIVMEEEVYSK